MSKSRSRSPLDTTKPLWLQAKDPKLQKDISSRSIAGNTSKSPMSKLNKRQTEQLTKETPVNIHNKFKTIFGEEEDSIQFPKQKEDPIEESI